MKVKKVFALLSVFILGFDSMLLAPVVLASEKSSEDLVATPNELIEENIYFRLDYDGTEKEVSLSKDEQLFLKGWKDEKKMEILAEYHFLEKDDTKKNIEFEIKILEEGEAEKYSFPSDKELVIRAAESEKLEWKEITPLNIVTEQMISEENKNGTFVFQEVKKDEWDTILEKEEPLYYQEEENGEYTLLTKEEYDELNQTEVEETENPEEDTNDQEMDQTDADDKEESSDTDVVNPEDLDDQQVEEDKENEEEADSSVQVEEEKVEELEGEVAESKEESKEESKVESKKEEKDSEEIPQTYSLKNISPSIVYSTHIQKDGWSKESKNGEKSGTEGQKKRLEAIKIGATGVKGLGVTYSTHVQSTGWTSFVSNGIQSGTQGQAKRLEAIKISLTGTQAANYDIYYRVHAETYGWLDWAANGQSAGTSALGKRLESIQIKLVKKGEAAPGNTSRPYVVGSTSSNPSHKPTVAPLVSYQTYVQGLGWQSPVSNGQTAGTQGKNKKIEAIRLDIQNVNGLNIEYSTHMQSVGWNHWQAGPEMSGIAGSGKRMEALKIRLTGNMAVHYDVYYRVHSQSLGWLGWAKNSEPAGTENFGYRAEAIEVKVVPKDSKFEQQGTAFQKKDPTTLLYSSYVENKGWSSQVTSGKPSGTIGHGLRMEALKISLKNSQYSGGISYRTHVESTGWTNDVANGAVTGTTNQGKRLEAIEIRLTGELANHYDVFYRTHAQSYSWLGWAKNGMPSGTEGMGKRLESIEIRLVAKGADAPQVSEDGAFKQTRRKKVIFVDAGHGGSETGASYYGKNEKDLNLVAAEKVRQQLEAAGFVVIMSRTTDTYIDHVTKRSEMANASGADLFISVHHNAMPYNSGVTGIETFYYESDPNWPPAINGDMHNDPQRLKDSEALAHAVQNSLISATGAVNRKVQKETFAVLRETKIPAILVELGFMSSREELDKITSDSYQNTLARAVTSGVLNFYKNK